MLWEKHDNRNVNFLSERHGPSQNLAFLGIMCALDVVLAVLASFVPLSSFFIVVLLPLISALAVVLAEDKYIPIYVVAAIGLVLGTTAYDLQETFFYVIPAIVDGSLYGFLLKKKLPWAYVIFASALLEMAFNYLSIPVVQAIYDLNPVETGEAFLGVSPEIGSVLLPAFFFSLGLGEAAISHFAISFFFSKFHLVFPQKEKAAFLYPVFAIIFANLALFLPFANLPWAYFFLVSALYWAVFSFVLLISQPVIWIYIPLGLLEIASVIVFACCYRFYPHGAGLTLSAIFLLSVAIPALAGSLLLKGVQKPLK
jgi:hypothetical protein